MAAPAHSISDNIIGELRHAVAHDPDAAMRGGLLAMRAHLEEVALPLLHAAAARHNKHAGLVQVLGLVARNLGDLDTACQALALANALAPNNALIAHGLARARLEAGLPAIDAFHRACRLAPADGSVILGLAAARFAMHDVDSSIDGLVQTLKRVPSWIDGHATLARLRRMAGMDGVFASYHEALASAPHSTALWQSLLTLMGNAECYADLPPVLAAARRAAPDTLGLDLWEAVVADETGDAQRAGSLFDAVPVVDDASMIVRRVRSLMRRGRIADAAMLAHDKTTLPGGDALWPYVAIAWRLLDDPRWHWLEGNPDYVGVYDLADEVGDLTTLATQLRSLHLATDQPLDQSVRNGTQTDGPLFSRINSQISRLRRAVDSTVSDYIARLPAPDLAHPLLSAPRRPRRFAGSWSVRLTEGGHHADHVHGQGWISSAFYVSLPETLGGADDAGWLTLGGSRALLPGLMPFRSIEPRPGRLVLFPSTMWHGTNRFGTGERLTVAFDMARLG